MNKQTKALKMVIEALQNIDNWLPTIGQRGLRDYEADALQACKEAIVSDVTDIDVGEITQPAERPSKLEMAGFELDGVIADGYREGLDNVSLSTIKRVRKTISDYVAQPAQEPVAWNEEEFNAIAYAYRTCPAHEIKMVSDRYQELVNYVLSITHPAPSWQGLTSEEIRSLDLDNDVISVIFQTEKLLKEKNT